MFRKPLIILIYTVLVAVISAVITTGYIHSQYVLSVKVDDTSPHQSLTQIDQNKVNASPIKEKNTIVELFSYGCHFCLVNEKNVAALSARMPEGTKIIHLHLANKYSGLSRYSNVFATLTVMGIEEQYREKLYDAVRDNRQDISNAAVREAWLTKVGIDVASYNKASESQETKDLEKYMADISTYYNIRATPSFIVNKKWIATQDRDFPAFADNLLSLLKNDKPLEQ